MKTGSKYSQAEVDLPDFLEVHVWQKQNILYCLCSPPDHSFAGSRKVNVFVLKSPLSAVFFLAFRCFGEYFPSETVSWCFLVYLFSVRVQVPSVYSGRSRQIFRRRTLSWQLLQQNLGSSSLSETSISHTLRIILFNCNAFPLSLKKFFSWSSHHKTGTYFLKYRPSKFGIFPCPTTAGAATQKTANWFGTVKRANHSVCFITAQLLAGANEKWPCIHLYQISLFSVKQSEIWVRD